MNTRRFRSGMLLVVAGVFPLAAPAALRGAATSEILPNWQLEVPVSPCGVAGYAIGARASAGELMRRSDQLISDSAEGDLRWQASVDCAEPDLPEWEHAILTPDGGACGRRIAQL